MAPSCLPMHVFCKKATVYGILIASHHSLIRWRVVVHGGIDGFSRMITCLALQGTNSIQMFLNSHRRVWSI